MMTKSFIIKKLTRFPITGSFDELTFELGVNVIVGKPNAGKTLWLTMLDYLMGDTDSPVDALGSDLAEKYEAVRGIFLIDNDEIVIERRWKQRGSIGKVFINEEPIAASDFSSHLMRQLNVPVLHFPQGDPYSARSWPELSWRSLLRHIYRKQTSWNDLATKQPEADQRACLMLFLGIAEYLFSDKYEELIRKRKDIYTKIGAKDNFVNTLNEISKEILDNREISLAVTVNSISSAIAQIDDEIGELESRRATTLENLFQEVLSNQDSNAQVNHDIAFEEIGQSWAKLKEKGDNVARELERAQSRLEELRDYQKKIADELSRVERAQDAGQVFARFRVTHCPACGQSVHLDRALLGCCHLCSQTINTDINSSNASEQRLDFEIAQLREEAKEADQLIQLVNVDINKLKLQQRAIQEDLIRIQSQMRPLQVAAAIIMPPDIALIDMELGRLHEKKRQVERVRGALELQSNLSQQIDNLEREVKFLESEVSVIEQEINFEKVSDEFTAHVNDYLNQINGNNPGSWTQGAVAFRLKERGFSLTINGTKWNSKLGATMKLYFLTAYNYALLSLSNKESYHYPGLTILDLPPTFEGELVKDKENFILEPFIELGNSSNQKEIQVIATGNSFEGLEGVNRIELTQVWE